MLKLRVTFGTGQRIVSKGEGMTIPVYKSKYFVPAIALALLSAAFTFGPGGARWLWADQPVVAGMLLATSLVFWGLLFASRRKT